MSSKIMAVAASLTLLIIYAGCDEGIDDWNSSAKLSGYVYADRAHTQGVPGVQVIFEADPDADVPYEGPDRWTTTDNSGYFEGFVFLGNRAEDNEPGYNYRGDMSVSYFWNGKSFSWVGGVTVGVGSHFTFPAVDTTMFQ